MQNIRNFSIIAHINHGKSTLSDRVIQICGGLNEREMVCQVLDSMELERERGITIKAQNVTLNYKSYNGQIYKLNLIDTPGHVDFTYEVFRSLSVCDGALLVIDSSQGIEAQTLANYRIAKEMNLKVIIVLNKIDLLIANPNRVCNEIKDIIGDNNISNIVRCSSKTGVGILNVLEHIVHDIPAPTGNPRFPLQVLVIDSWFNNYLGVVSLICIKNGILHKGDLLKSMNTGKQYVANQIGIFTPKQVHRMVLHCGEVGWLICSVKHSIGFSVGDTLTLSAKPAKISLPGFKKITPCVYAGLFPINPTTQESFKDALYKLSLNDASLTYEIERSDFFGLGFRCGFFGLLHMEIIQERLKREYSLELVVTPPMVTYEILTDDNKLISISNPSKFLSIVNIKEIREPIALCNIVFPKKYIGGIIELCIKKRGVQISIKYYNDQVILKYELPISEIMLDFFDRLKSISQGYASFEYEFVRFQKSNMVCLELSINKKRIDTLAMLVHSDMAEYRGRILVNKLQTLIPRQQFDILIQAIVRNRVICCSIVKQLRKHVTFKCYGGDITRKKKLLNKQKEGKKRMKLIGHVKLPQSVFFSILHNNK